MTAQATRAGFQRKPQYGPKRICKRPQGYPLYGAGWTCCVPHSSLHIERMMVIETTSPVWQTGALTFVLHPQVKVFGFQLYLQTKSHVLRLIALAYASFLHNIYYVIQLYSHRIFL